MKILLFLIPFVFSGCVGIGIVHQEKLKNEHCEGTPFSSFNNLTYVEKNEDNLSIYKRKTDEYNLKGIIPMIGIGIPLVVPFGYNYDYYYFENDICLIKESENSTWSGFMCGVLNENGKMGCSSLGN